MGRAGSEAAHTGDQQSAYRTGRLRGRATEVGHRLRDRLDEMVPVSRLWLIFPAVVLQAIAGPIHWRITDDIQTAAVTNVILRTASFLLLFLVAVPRLDAALRSRARWLPSFCALFAIGLCVAALASWPFIAPRCAKYQQYDNDAIALAHYASDRLLAGENPYVGGNVMEALERYRMTGVQTTPLKEGVFSHLSLHPTGPQMRVAYELARLEPKESPPEFESRLSYPAGSFLFHTPLIALGWNDLRLFYLLTQIALVAIAWRASPPKLRPLLLVLAFADVELWTNATSGRLDSLWAIFLLAAWVWRDRFWPSAVCMGMAIATKQTVWFYAPFYFILVYQTSGWRDMLARLRIVALAFLTLNLPFILDAPASWAHGVLVPLVDPMFPRGDGLISISIAGVLPLWPSYVYTALELTALGLAGLWYWRYGARNYPNSALLLATVPLFVGWRSLASYFYLTPLLLFAAVLSSLREQPMPEAEPERVPRRLITRPSMAA